VDGRRGDVDHVADETAAPVRRIFEVLGHVRERADAERDVLAKALRREQRGLERGMPYRYFVGLDVRARDDQVATGERAEPGLKAAPGRVVKDRSRIVGDGDLRAGHADADRRVLVELDAASGLGGAGASGHDYDGEGEAEKGRAHRSSPAHGAGSW